MQLIDKIIIGVLAIALLISVVFNVVLSVKCGRTQGQDTTIERDTVVSIQVVRDTVYKEYYYEVVNNNPIPTSVDTTNNIKQYKDTIYHEYGKIYQLNTVRGDLLSNAIQLDLKIPTFYETNTITYTINNKIRNPLFFATAGIRMNELRTPVPMFGLTTVSRGHRYMIGFDYGLDHHMNVRLGIALRR